MKKTNQERTEQSNNRFWHGLFLGVFSSLFLATVFVYTYLSAGGFRIELDRNLPALFVRDQIKKEAWSELSLLLEKLKLELPVAISRAFQDPEGFFIPYEEGAVSLPREMGEAARGRFQNLAEESVLGFLKDIDLTPYIEGLGQVALVEAKKAFNQEVAGKTYHFKVNPLLTIPVEVSAP